MDCVYAEERWTAIGQPVANGLTVAVEAARLEVQRQETTAMLARLEAVRSSRGRSVGRSLGLGRR